MSAVFYTYMKTTKFFLAIAIIAATVLALPLFAETESAEVLKDLDQVSKALANDDLGAAKTAASGLSETATAAGNQTLAKHAAELAKSDSLDNAREHLKAMGSEAAKLAQGAKQYQVMTCPMANATWIQSGDKVMNPYMGKKMQQCGSMAKGNEGASTGAAAGMGCCAMG